MEEPAKPSAYDLARARYLQDAANFPSRMAAYRAAQASYDSNISICDANPACQRGSAPTAPVPPTAPTETTAPTAAPTTPGQPAAPPPAPIRLSPQQVAEIAVAQLTVPAVKPGIGPPPSINQWKMAVVGYPLWLWADGPAHLGPVGQTVGTQSVSLTADLGSVSYAMGDGHSVTCPGAGTPWTRAVPPGAASPSCGYHYTKASLPSREYTVTAIATWTVAWTVDGQTGTIPVYTRSSVQLPVGELQAVVH